MTQKFFIGLFIFAITACGQLKQNEGEAKDAKLTKVELSETSHPDQEKDRGSALNRNDDLQSNPRSVAEEVFKIANAGDLSFLAELCDPNGEVNRNAQRICDVLSTSKEEQEDFMNYFKLGSVVEEVVIEGDQATVQVKFGYDGSRDGRFKMINRGGKWYLFSF